jgi:hypothetical protein
MNNARERPLMETVTFETRAFESGAFPHPLASISRPGCGARAMIPVHSQTATAMTCFTAGLGEIAPRISTGTG